MSLKGMFIPTIGGNGGRSFPVSVPILSPGTVLQYTSPLRPHLIKGNVQLGRSDGRSVPVSVPVRPAALLALLPPRPPADSEVGRFVSKTSKKI